RVDATLRAVFARGGPFELNQRLVLTTGEVRYLSIRGEAELGPAGRPLRAWGSAQDVTERHRVQEELRRTALTDPLTGLGNRLLLVARLQRAIIGLAAGGAAGPVGPGGAGPVGASGPGPVGPVGPGGAGPVAAGGAGPVGSGGAGPVAVIAVDLDGLKRVNDTHGHATGDELLRETARRLRSAVRERDLVARLGGDEFVLVCVDVDEVGAAALAERIVAEISIPYSLPGGVTAWSGASVGVTVTADPSADVDRLLAQADRALYAAKSEGGNRYAVCPQSAPAALQGLIAAAGGP
ncbi:MAG TPA: GGDEF domain-containing protein, partial [Mycobacteriales bacterium]|nr:GGDEF domain-containing protein [Mycobacteriales bacterium]